MSKIISPQVLVNLSFLAATALAGLPGTGSAQTIFFTENFDDTSFAARGWYDSTGGTVDSANHIPGSTASFNCHWAQGGTVCASPGRHLFTASPTVYVSFWMKLGSATVTWQGSGKPYHPHLVRLFTDADNQFVAPNGALLQVGVEMMVFTPRVLGIDSMAVNVPLVGTDLLASATPHAVMGGNGSQNASATYYLCPPPAPPNVGAYCNSTTWDAASPVYVNNKWHRAEFYVAMNSTSGGIANKDGVFKHWIDGNLVVDYNNVQLRTGDNPNRKFNQFALLPFIGDGSPIAQDLWIDNLIVADQRIASGPPAPTNLRMLP